MKYAKTLSLVALLAAIGCAPSNETKPAADAQPAADATTNEKPAADAATPATAETVVLTVEGMT